MGEVPTEAVISRTPTIPDSEGFDWYLRQYDAFIETTTQMLITPKLSERLNLALEGVANVLGHPQAAIAIINERDAVMRILATRGFTRSGASSHRDAP